MEDNKGQILLYQTPDGESCIEVRLQGETLWLNREVVVSKYATTTQHGAIGGKTQSHIDNYNLD